MVSRDQPEGCFHNLISEKNINSNNNDLYSLREKCSYRAHTINDII